MAKKKRRHSKESSVNLGKKSQARISKELGSVLGIKGKVNAEKVEKAIGKIYGGKKGAKVSPTHGQASVGHIGGLFSFLGGSRVNADSSNVRAYQYDENREELFVGYKGKGKKNRGTSWYGYEDVDPGLASAFYAAPSHGKAVWDYLRVRGSSVAHQKAYRQSSAPDWIHDDEVEYNAQHKALGGMIQQRFGTPGMDNEPVSAESGEFIVNKSQTEKNKPILEAINQGADLSDLFGDSGSRGSSVEGPPSTPTESSSPKGFGRRAISGIKDANKKFYDWMKARYGVKTAMAIAASGQVVGWGAFFGGSAIGVPVWLPTPVNMLPGLAAAELWNRYGKSSVGDPNKSTKDLVGELGQASHFALGGIVGTKPLPAGRKSLKVQPFFDTHFGDSKGQSYFLNDQFQKLFGDSGVGTPDNPADPLELIANAIGAPEGSSVQVGVGHHDDTDEYGIFANVKHPDVKHMQRWLGINKGKREIHNSLFKMQKGKGGKGTGLDAFSHQVAWAQALGFDKITTHAARKDDPDPEKRMNGYLTWPKFGYNQDLDMLSYDTVKKIQSDFGSMPKTVQDLLALPGGEDWWAKHGTDLYQAEFDLHEGSRSHQILSAYQKKKGYASPWERAGVEVYSPQWHHDPKTDTYHATDATTDATNAIEALFANYNRPQHHALGGMIQQRFGTPGMDNEPISAEPGEFVINKEQAQKHKELLEAINSGQGPKSNTGRHMASGGEIDAGAVASHASQGNFGGLIRSIANPVIAGSVASGSIGAVAGAGIGIGVEVLAGLIDKTTESFKKLVDAIQDPAGFLSGLTAPYADKANRASTGTGAKYQQSLENLSAASGTWYIPLVQAATELADKFNVITTFIQGTMQGSFEDFANLFKDTVGPIVEETFGLFKDFMPSLQASFGELSKMIQAMTGDGSELFGQLADTMLSVIDVLSDPKLESVYFTLFKVGELFLVSIEGIVKVLGWLGDGLGLFLDAIRATVNFITGNGFTVRGAEQEERDRQRRNDRLAMSASGNRTVAAQPARSVGIEDIGIDARNAAFGMGYQDRQIDLQQQSLQVQIQTLQAIIMRSETEQRQLDALLRIQRRLETS